MSKPITSVRIFERTASNAKELIDAIQAAAWRIDPESKALNQFPVQGAFAGGVRVCVRKYSDGAVKICVGD